MSSLRVTPPLLYTAGAIFAPVCVIIVAARFLTRKGQRVNFGWDDWLVLPALAAVIGMAIAILVGTAVNSLGHPTPKHDPAKELTETSYEETVARKIYFMVNLMQIAALCFIKCSCVLFFRRIFRTGISKMIDGVLMALLAIMIVWGVSFFFAFLTLCGSHVDYAWGSVATELTCASTTMANQALSISDVITDLMVMIFPIPLIWRLQMSTRNKIAVTFIFLLGTLAVTASIGRTVVIFEELNAKFKAGADQDLVSTAGIYFMFIEACFGLCSICLPTLSGALKQDGFHNFVEGFSSLFSLRQRSRSGLEADPTDMHQRLGSQHSGSDVTRYHSDLEGNSQSMELQNGKAIKVTKSFEYTRSMA